MPLSQSARLLPSVDELLKRPPLANAEAQLGHEIAVRAARQVLQKARDVILSAAKDLPGGRSGGRSFGRRPQDDS